MNSSDEQQIDKNNISELAKTNSEQESTIKVSKHVNIDFNSQYKHKSTVNSFSDIKNKFRSKTKLQDLYIPQNKNEANV